MTYEMQPEDMGLNNWPADWEVETTHRGLSRNTTSQRYHVRLSVAGAQRFIACASSQHKGAKLYDLALWKLAAFLPRIQPNFPMDFTALTQADVDLQCPGLNELYSQVETAVCPTDDLTERERREKAFERMAESKKISVKSTITGYSRYKGVVGKFRVSAITLAPRILAERLMLNFTKFPELQQAAADFETKLRQSDEAAAHLQFLLTSHSEVYTKLSHANA